ncbi:MAG: hypothetical protein PHH59_08380 [Methylovulum sp.]|uniref:hypothetical protein n=1 Tax=Methylovulum sp. TaxID=1916980 RepID=UPI0026294B73|nr:hypothetical protein [Methylovulum sp.]MDD2724019.1 hypothetical protein [Methylovulum sp.]
MPYDGTSKLGDAIAALYGCSPRSHNKIAALVREAKAGLGINSKTKKMPDAVKLAIYRWHYERLNPVQYVKQVDNIQYEPVQSVGDAIVQDVKQDVAVQNDTDNLVYDFKQVHFAVTFTRQGQPKRTTVMLEGYLVKALQRKHGLTDNAAIRAWIEQAIKSDGVRFDSFAPLTRQVKRMIIESFV